MGIGIWKEDAGDYKGVTKGILIVKGQFSILTILVNT